MSFKTWLADALKLNPAQPGIAASERFADPQSIIDYKEAFGKVEVIHRCVEMIINAACGIPFKVDGGPAQKITKLLNDRPNPFEDRARFFRRAILDLYLDGNCFIFWDKSIPGDALFIIPANDMSIIPDKKTFVAGYEYTPLANDDAPGSFATIISGRRKPKKDSTNKPIQFASNEIIHIKADSQESILRGEPKLKNLQRLIELYYAMVDFQRQFFKNNAIPGFVLQTDNVLSRNVKERLLAEWTQAYSSLFKGARNPAILDGGLKIDKFSNVNFRELDFENSIDRIQEDMSKALGVPYVLIKSGNNANISPNVLLFYMFTIIPLMSQFASAFQLRFPGTSVVPDKFAVEALRPDLKAQAQYWSTLVNSGIATPAEARENLRLPVHEDTSLQDIRVPANITGSATNPSLGGRPSEPHAPDDTSQTRTQLLYEHLDAAEPVVVRRS